MNLRQNEMLQILEPFKGYRIGSLGYPWRFLRLEIHILNLAFIWALTDLAGTFYSLWLLVNTVCQIAVLWQIFFQMPQLKAAADKNIYIKENNKKTPS